MDSRTFKRIAATAQARAEYDAKIKIWHVHAPSGSSTLTAKEVDKMTPDKLRRKLGLKPEKAVKKAKAKPERKPRGAFDPEAKITAVASPNPKREGSKAHAVFSLYREGMTVAEFIQAGGSNDDLRWDAARKLVKVGK